MRKKTEFCLCENKGADQLRSNCEADQHLFFVTRIVQFRIVQFLYFINPKFQASNHLLNLHRLVCGNPEDWFSRVVAHMIMT